MLNLMHSLISNFSTISNNGIVLGKSILFAINNIGTSKTYFYSSKISNSFFTKLSLKRSEVSMTNTIP